MKTQLTEVDRPAWSACTPWWANTFGVRSPRAMLRSARLRRDRRGPEISHLVTQFRFPLGGGRQGILFRLDRTLARLLHTSALSSVEFNVRLKFGWNVL